MIPEGLVLLTSVALAAGAFTLGRHQVLVRELPAIEALARVDTLCLDKTGTITSGKLVFERVEPWNQHDLTAVEHRLAALVTAIDDDNETARPSRLLLVSHQCKRQKFFPFLQVVSGVGLRLMVTLTLWAHRNLFLPRYPASYSLASKRSRNKVIGY